LDFKAGGTYRYHWLLKGKGKRREGKRRDEKEKKDRNKIKGM
jgi:hypothetical protein